MAKVYITEFALLGRDTGGFQTHFPLEPGLANQVVTIGATSAASNAFNAETAFVRIHTDAICSIEFGADPTAAATTRRLAAGSTEYFAVPKGQSYKVAVITNS